MSLPARLVVLVLLLGGLVAAGVWLSGDAGSVADGPTVPVRWQSSADCRDCHREVWDEWYGSHHQIAFLNPQVRALSDDFRNKECRACHLPRPISITGYGQRVLPRETRPDEGVGCLTCHLGAQGEVLGRRTLPSAPCRPQQSDEAMSVDACASCHNQHKTTDQWRASPQAAQGITCHDCHMPEVERTLAGGVPKAGGRGHVFPGAHDVATLRAAGTFTAKREGDELVLALTNGGAGHNFPTEERHRAVDIVYRFDTGDGPGEWVRAFRFRQPYRDEPGEDTQLAAGATHVERVAIPDGAVRAVSRLWYRLTPFVGDDDPASTLLFEHEVPLR